MQLQLREKCVRKNIILLMTLNFFLPDTFFHHQPKMKYDSSDAAHVRFLQWKLRARSC